MFQVNECFHVRSKIRMQSSVLNVCVCVCVCLDPGSLPLEASDQREVSREISPIYIPDAERSV